MTNEDEINEYLRRLQAGLTGMTLAEREDIVEEIRMHIQERAGDDALRIEKVLGGLGAAEELAKQYRTGLLLQQAHRSISPLVILRATLRWALTGIEGTAVFLIAVVGYATGAAFLLLALLKPIFPRHTGLWVGPGVFNFSFETALPPAGGAVRELLGWWLIPVCLVMGSLILAGTTKLLQFLMKRFRWRRPFHRATGAAVSLAAV